MTDPKPIPGARPLLFDRLIDRAELEEQTQPLPVLNKPVRFAKDERERPSHMLNCEQLKASVRRELDRLLNTRCSIPLDQLGDEERSVVNYGIPDFSSLSPDNVDDRALIASIVGQTISAFEPRLRNVRVEVGHVARAESAMWLNINAELVVGSFIEPVGFPVTLNSKNGMVDMHDLQ